MTAQVPSPRSPRRELALITSIGCAAGLASGLFGIGGGLIMVPALVLGMSFSQHRAHANSLGAVIPIAMAASIPYLLAGQVAVPLAVAIAVPAVVATQFGARWMRAMSETQLKMLFGALMLLVAVRMLAGITPAPEAQLTDVRLVLLAGTAIGVVAGIASSMLGVGGGLIMVPAMVLVLGITQQLAEGTSLIAIVPIAIAGTLSHRRSGFVTGSHVIALGAGGVVAGVIGSIIALKLSGVILQRGLALLLLFALAQMVGPTLVQFARERAGSSDDPETSIPPR